MSFLPVAKLKQSTSTSRSRALPPIQETFCKIYGLSPLPYKQEEKIHVVEKQTNVSMQKNKLDHENMLFPLSL